MPADNVARGLALRPVTLGDEAPDLTGDRQWRVAREGNSTTYSVALSQIALAATPTDVFYIGMASERRTATIRRIAVSLVADSAAWVDVGITRRTNTALTNVTQITGGQVTKHDAFAPSSSAYCGYWSANPASAGTRYKLRCGKLLIGTSTTAGTVLTFDFGSGSKAPTLRSLIEWFTVDLYGQTLPANTKLSMDIEWVEEPVHRIIFAGDSTYSAANELFEMVGLYPALAGYQDVRNYGSNGMRIDDFINNTNGIPYPLSAVTSTLGFKPERATAVIGYGINDVRTGAMSQAQLIAKIETVITTLKTGLDNGRAGMEGLRIILHGPNAFLSDDPTASGAVTSTGLFSGMTLAQAAQAASDILYGAYESFRGDSRLVAVVQRQAVLGRTCVPFASSTTMLDLLHPNAKGRQLIAEQLLPYLDLH